MSENLSISWQIVKLEWDESTGGVLSARWNVCVSDGELTTYSPGSTKFDPLPDESSFIPLENLDEETVLSWVKNSVYNVKLLEERAVQRFNREKKISSTVSGLPWG